MWELIGTPKTLKVSNKLAKDWAELPPVKVDRELNERRLQAYEKMVVAGAFRPVSWAKVYCVETEECYRVNGKHTSTLFSTLDLAKVPPLYVVIEEYKAETIDDCVLLYSTFDSRLQLRTASDINRSFAAVIPDLAEVPYRSVNLLVAGLSTYFNPVKPSEGTAAERAERLFDNVPVCHWVLSVLPGAGVSGASSTRHLHRAPIVGAMIACWQKAKNDATSFWSMVRDETGSTPNSPDRRLAKYLLTTGSHGDTRRKAGFREIYAKCIHAWNAWRKNATTDLKYFPDAKIPSPV